MFKILFVVLLIILIFVLLISGIFIRVYRMFKPKTDKHTTPPQKTQKKKEIKGDDSRVIDVDFEDIK